MRNKQLSGMLLALGLSCALNVSARERVDLPANAGGQKNGGRNNKITASCLTSSSSSSLDINNVRAMVLNGGDMWWNLFDPRYEIPKVDDPGLPKKHSLFSGAVWIGGQDAQNNLYLASQTYRQSSGGGAPDAGYWPGPLDNTGNITKEECAAWNYHAKIDKATVDKFREDFSKGIYASREESLLPQTIREWPAKKNPFVKANMNHELAPFVDVGGAPDEYNPLDGDYPDFRGDQGIWWVMNDAGNVKEPLSSTIGLELQVLAFAFQTNNLINNMTFYKQKLINKGPNTLNNTYLGQWVDADLGFYNDDFVGCDVARGLGFCYNGDNDDEGANGYGLNPPAIGVDFFQGPTADAGDGIDNDRDGTIDEAGEKIIMSSFIYYNNDSNPTNGNPSRASDFYNYLQAIWKDGKQITFGGDGTNQSNQPYKFMFSDKTDPQGFGFTPPKSATVPFEWSETKTQATGQSSNTPADRRFLQSAGPFTLAQGAVNELTIGVVWARANSGGARGSEGLLKVADDMAQELFDNDFKLPQGPNAPDLAITELDQQLVLTLIPATFRNSNDEEVTTETYFERNQTLANIIGNKDPFYRFEGYKVYQLKDPTVTSSELSNPDRARLVAQADLKNGVTDIINREFDADVNSFRDVLKVRGNDKGLFHTVNITTDQFATGNDRIVNFKSYHFMVVAYAYNGDSTNKNNQYLEGRVVSTGTGIPHKPQVENGGTLLTAAYGTAAGITRIFGTGTGGNVLEIMPEDEQDIVRDNSKQKITYRGGNAPFTVKVYDPKKVVGGDFTVKMSSRLVYKKSSASGTLNLNDTILASGNFTRPDSYSTNTPSTMSFPQVPGRGIVRRVVSVEALRDTSALPGDSLVTLDVEMLNDHLSGTFTVKIDEKRVTGPPNNQSTVFFGYKTEPRPFNSLNSNFNAVAYEYVQNDLWNLKKPNGDTVYADKPVSIFNEQLVPEFGIAIEFKQANNPGYLVQENPLNGYLESSISFASAPRWLEGVRNGNPSENPSFQSWLLPRKTTTVASDLDPLDPNYVYLNVINGTWAPYAAAAVAPVGPAYNGTNSTNRKLNNLQNIDVVITSDKSKWTRVVVLQGNAGLNAAFELTKKGSTAQSIDVNRNPDPSAPSPTGMGWFPGYAIDLDRGIRLNMMFSEFNSANGKGNDLIWEPNSEVDGGKNFIYVMNTRYDQGTAIANTFDQIASIIGPTPYQTQAQNQVFNNAMWVGYPRLAKGATLLASDVRVRLRVNREFTSYTNTEQYNVTSDNRATTYKGNFNPEYTFTTNNLVPQVNQTSIAQNGLDLIRVVPNPYYAYSQYEQRQLDNIVKITNLPRKCKIQIYTVNGTLVRTYNKDDSKTFLDWNLKNDNNLPIASGVYIIHVDAGNIGSKVVKFFGIMRPIDLESF